MDLAISNVPFRLPYDYISGVLELSIRHVHCMFDLETDPSMLLPLLLNQLIILGQTAQQFKQNLGKNVDYPSYEAEKPNLEK